ncbi:mitochondrial 37S ribosomal protein mS29 RSM23 [Sporobolomyces salmoneus]|uniref:mitochondrial 37S ribosomal protein mS29 RSM23 n=1 Tax=Sporobolomyces salmoneus TaxID=183962 RepID=UPI00317B2DCD
MSGLQASLDQLVRNPAYHDILAILKGARNGLVYGARVRGPHALVMSLIFQSGTLQQRLKYVYKATKQHSLNLAKFVAIYKTCLLLQKTLAGGKQRSLDTFFAGLIGGWCVFGERNAVNEQIVLYVVSRVITSFLPRAGPPAPPSGPASARPTTAPDGFPLPPGYPYPKSRPPNSKVFEVYAAVAWGVVMYLFRERRDTLHGGMVHSMQYLYNDSEVWNNLKTLLWLSSKAALFARNKKQATEGDDAASGSGTGNILSEVTLPPPDLSRLETMHPESLTQGAVGKVKAFPAQTLDAFKTLSIPSSVQKEFSFSTKPATVVRGATLEVKKLLDESKKGSSKESRHIFHGGAGTGKSTLMLQAVSYAQASGYIVFYLPSATPLVNSSTPHIYSQPRSLFDQPLLSSSLLSKLSSVNKAAFKELKTSKEHTFTGGASEKKVAAGKSLEELCKAAGGDEKIVTSVFEALLEELSTQNSRPVLLAIDDCQSLFATTRYVDPSYHSVESFSLVVPRLLLEFVSGQRQFASGAVLLSPSSLSPSQSPAMTDFLSSSSTTSTLSSPYDRATTSSYSTYSSLVSSLSKFSIPSRLTSKEAVGVVELLKQIRGVRVREGKGLGDQEFLERLVGSDGNVREFVKGLRKSVVA